MSKTFLVIILLATFVLMLTVPAVSGISLLQQAKAERSSQGGLTGLCPPNYLGGQCNGGGGGIQNVRNSGSSYNGNGGDGGRVNYCYDIASGHPLLCTYSVVGGNGGDRNSDNSGKSNNGNGGEGGQVGRCENSGFPSCELKGGQEERPILIIL
jgi:hypothetical protein